MSERFKAIFNGEAFVPLHPCDLPEGAQVELIVQGAAVLPPQVKEPDERKRILKEIVESMRNHSFPIHMDH